MNATDLAAIVGALAWVPQIMSWVGDFFAKPQLKLFAPPSPEVGFTLYGTVLNLSCAISASVDDAVIERMEAELVHERGQRILLPWGGIHETLAEIEMPTGEIERHRQQQVALALKVSVVELAERIIMFQDSDFQTRLVAAFTALENRRDHVAQHETTEMQGAAVRRSDEFTAVTSLVRSGMMWQEGTYSVVFRAKIAERHTPFEFKYSFHLSTRDIAQLQENTETMLTAMIDQFAAEPNKGSIQWNWRYPNMLPDKIKRSHLLGTSVRQ